jgi:hypothetical protein
MDIIKRRKPAHRKKQYQFAMRVDDQFLQMIKELKLAHPDMGKGDVVYYAVKRLHETEFR